MGVATGKLDGGPGAVEGVQGVCHRGHAVLAGHAADAELDRVGVVGLVLVGNLDGREAAPAGGSALLGAAAAVARSLGGAHQAHDRHDDDDGNDRDDGNVCWTHGFLP